MKFLQELKRSKNDHEQRMKLTTRFSYLIDKVIENTEEQQKEIKRLERCIDLLGNEYKTVLLHAERYEQALRQISESKEDTSCNEIALKYEVIAEKALNS